MYQSTWYAFVIQYRENKMGKKYVQKRLQQKEERLKQKLKEKELAKEKMECGCGRSPTGKCIGWHALSEEEYQEKLKEYKDKD